VAAAPTTAGLVHSTLAEAGNPSPTAGVRHPTGHHAIAPKVSSALPRRRAAVVVGTAVVCWRPTWSAWMVLGRRRPGWMVLGRRRPTRSARIPLRRGRAVTCLTGDGGRACWCGVCRARTHTSGGYAESGRDGDSRDQLLHLHVHCATPVL
jgi:hypothetical protein